MTLPFSSFLLSSVTSWFPLPCLSFYLAWRWERSSSVPLRQFQANFLSFPVSSPPLNLTPSDQTTTYSSMLYPSSRSWPLLIFLGRIWLCLTVTFPLLLLSNPRWFHDPLSWNVHISRHSILEFFSPAIIMSLTLLYIFTISWSQILSLLIIAITPLS